MISIDPELIREMSRKGKRIDNRGFDEYRKIVIEKDAVATADGSGRVRIGDTEVIAGVKFGIGTPFPDTPDEGTLMVGTELLPLASPHFESGPPGEDAIEISRVVDRAIRESKVIDFKQLCMIPKEKVWMVYIDIDVINDDGNIIDACSMAAATALLDAKMPVLNEEGNIDYDKKGTEPLPITGLPVSTTIIKIGENIMADPSLPEMDALDSRLTVGTFEKDGETYLCSMQKGGTSGLTAEEIESMMNIGCRKGDELREQIKRIL